MTPIANLRALIALAGQATGGLWIVREPPSKRTDYRILGHNGDPTLPVARTFGDSFGAQQDAAYAISRDSSLGNCQVLCRAHHAEKTFITDVPTIAKGKRVHANHIGAKKIARGFRKPSGTEYSWAQHRYVRISSGDDRDAQDAVERSKP